jgi:signal transduction histidine kinase
MVINAITHDSRYIRLQAFVVLVFYAATSFAITTYRIFNARQLVLLGIEKAILVAAVASAAYVLDSGLNVVLPEPLAFFVTTALSLWLAVTVNNWLDHAFRFYPQAISARQAAFVAAQRETRGERLEAAFEEILKGWGQTDHGLILYGAERLICGRGVEVPFDSDLLLTMRHLRWATPERLARERPSKERREVAEFLHIHNLGVLVIAEGPSLTAMVGVGIGASRRPFTYPQVAQLLELASIMESALERAYFSAKAQHSEQLATVGLLGANLAHEIRNPLVSIKTFVQLLPTHHQDPVFREKFFRLIGEEVTRIDQLTEQLLDLATPRTYSASQVELHAVLRSSLDLVAAKAGDKGVEFRTDFRAAPDRVFTDPAAAKQVLLNLCFNAIQAVEARGEGERWIKIATQNAGEGVEMVVSDSGLGIAPEIHPRLFQPFQTTKSSGFGLGLAICRDILANLRASISVDPPVPGQGATFRVTYPCQPSSS